MQNMKRVIIYVGVIFMVVLYTNCEYTPIVEPTIPIPDTISFSLDIEPIFVEQACIGCHKDNFKPVLTTGDAYNSLMSDPSYVVVDAPETSTIYTKPLPEGNHPAKYTNSQALLVLKWIQEGAKDN